MNVEENEMETNAIVDNTGRVMLFRSMITDISCNLNLQQFPFDQQVNKKNAKNSTLIHIINRVHLQTQFLKFE